jgi:hypothetical protein
MDDTELTAALAAGDDAALRELFTRHACSLVTGGLLAWTLPVGYMLFCQYALLELWRAIANRRCI